MRADTFPYFDLVQCVCSSRSLKQTSLESSFVEVTARSASLLARIASRLWTTQPDFRKKKGGQMPPVPPLATPLSWPYRTAHVFPQKHALSFPCSMTWLVYTSNCTYKIGVFYIIVPAIKACNPVCWTTLYLSVHNRCSSTISVQPSVSSALR